MQSESKSCSDVLQKSYRRRQSNAKRDGRGRLELCHHCKSVLPYSGKILATLRCRQMTSEGKASIKPARMSHVGYYQPKITDKNVYSVIAATIAHNGTFSTKRKIKPHEDAPQHTATTMQHPIKTPSSICHIWKVPAMMSDD